ncbi:MAG: hypothetical protein ACE5KQ_02130 [Thermoplasmata archaeon]
MSALIFTAFLVALLASVVAVFIYVLIITVRSLWRHKRAAGRFRGSPSRRR